MSAEIRHRKRKHTPAPFLTDHDLLALPVAQPVIARIAAATDLSYPHRMRHVEMVAAVAVRAKLNPCNAFAEPTL